MDDLTDDYVAELLAEDARKISRRCTKQNLSGLLSKPRPANALKPNTRFLQNIVREADQHNSALRRREEVEARARLRDLRRTVPSRNGQQPTARPQREKGHLSESGFISSRIDRLHSDKRPRDKRTERNDTSRGGNSDRVDRGSRDTRRSSNSHRTRQSQAATCSQSTFHPDQLDSLATAQKERLLHHDRGTPGSRTIIDQHFAADHDHARDIEMRSQDCQYDDDWEMALQALQDRRKWKANQASTMNGVGYTGQETGNWRHGFSSSDGREQDPGGLRWSKRGEVREWDHDKVAQ